MKKIPILKSILVFLFFGFFMTLPISQTRAEEEIHEAQIEEQNSDNQAPEADSVWGAMRYTGYHIEKGSVTTGHAIKDGSIKAGKTMEKGFKKAGRGIESGAKATGRGFKKAGKSIDKFFTGD